MGLFCCFFSDGGLCVFVGGFAIFGCYMMVFCGQVVVNCVAIVVCWMSVFRGENYASFSSLFF